MVFFTGSTASLRVLRAMAVGCVTVLLAGLSGCSLGTMQLSGPETGNTAVTVNLSGKLHGGQNGVAYSTVQIYAVGTNGYGGAANLLSTVTSGTNEYYPGGATGCNNTAVSITAYALSGGTATFTAANTMVGGQLVAISDSSPLSGSTYFVTSASATQFTVSTSNASTVITTADTGTATPTCYTNVVTDHNGNFTLTGNYSCGSFGASDVYVVASGGNPNNPSTSPTVNNSALKMVAPLLTAATPGVPITCSNLSSATYVMINEATTVAAAFAMGQYFGFSADSFSSPATTQAEKGLSNAVSTVGNLVSTTVGVPYTSFTVPGANGGSTITVTPEASKINTIANVLAACVNSEGTTDPVNTSCSTLFASTGGTTPTNTLEAAVDMSLNPLSTNSTNLGNIYNLSTGTGAPFGNTLAAQPTDWTIGINYASAASLPFALDLAADSNGNIWVLSNGSGSNGVLTELTPTGAANFYSSTFGSASQTIATQNPRNIAIDTNNNIYFTTSSSSYYEVKYSPGSGSTPAAATTATVLTFANPLNKSPYGLAIDGSNDVFIGFQSSSAYVELVEFPAGNFSLSSYITYPIATATPGTAGTSGTNSYIEPEYLAFDANGNLWMTGGSGTNPNAAVELTNINTSSCSSFPCTLTTSTTANTYVTSSTGGQSTPWGIAANGNNVWVANSALNNNSITAITPAGGTHNNTPGTATNYAPANGLNYPHYVAIDGAQNVWVANKDTTVSTPPTPAGATVSEFNSSGALLSEAGSSTVSGGFIHAGLNTGEGIAVDPSGNVWIANDAASAGVEEIVGAAAPVITPLASALAYKTANTTSTFPAKP